MYKTALLIVPIAVLLIAFSVYVLTAFEPNVYAAKHPSNSQRYKDGFSNGGQQASTDFQNHNPFNLACDPASVHGGGGHTAIYCRGWTNGYTATWNNLVMAQPTPNPTPSPPTNNTTTNAPTTNPTINPTSLTHVLPTLLPFSSPTTDSWVTPFILFVIVVVIIAAIARKIKHRGKKYRERQYFPDSIKENILDKQRHKCGHCNRLLNVVDYDHKDGDRSNNRESNCVALCPNCHAVKTRSTR